MSAIDDLKVKLAQTRVKAYIQKRGKKYVPVVSYKRGYDPADPANYRYRRSNDGGTAIVEAMDGKNRVATLTLRMDPIGRTAHVNNVHVNDRYRHQGIATRLAERFHAEHPDWTLSHGLFMSPEGLGFAEAIERKHPDWNRVSPTAMMPDTPELNARLDAIRKRERAKELRRFGLDEDPVNASPSAIVHPGFRDTTSPLDYHGHHPKRLAITDDQFYGSDGYFEDSGTIAFVDYDEDGMGGVGIHYIATESGRREQGLATQLVDELYRRYPGTINFGEVFSDAVEKMYRRKKDDSKTAGRTRGKLGPLSRPRPSGVEGPPESEDDYRMRHRPSEDGPPAHDLTAETAEWSMPKDVYDHPDWYVGDPGSRAARETIRVLRGIRGNPDAEVTIYRGAPEGTGIRPGDWVTFSPTYAREHGMHADDPSKDMPVHELKVRARDVRFAGDDLNEFGYFPDEQPTPAADVPPLPGETPIPEGHVRLFHITPLRNAESIRENGLTKSNAKGESYGEPNQIWASAGLKAVQAKRVLEGDIMDSDFTVIEFHVPVDRLDIGSKTGSGTDAEWASSLEARTSDVTIYGDVTPEDILAIHEPWHHAYRYLNDYREAVLNGEYDWAEEELGGYRRAIQQIKAEGRTSKP